MTPAHTGPAPLESPEAMSQRIVPLRGREHGTERRASEDEQEAALLAIRARDAQWIARLEAMAEEADTQRRTRTLATLAPVDAAASLRDAAKIGRGVPDHHGRAALLARNGRWGTCVDCPREDGDVYPERCEHTERHDHQLTKETP